MGKFASWLGFGIIVVSVVLLVGAWADMWRCLAGVVVGFVLFKHSSIEEISLGFFKLKRKVREAEQLAESLRNLARPLTEFLYLHIGTINLHPPGKTIEAALKDNLAKLVKLCWPDEQERNDRLAEMNNKIDHAQKNYRDR